MNFEYSQKTQDWVKRVSAFMDKHVFPNVETFQKQHEAGDRWTTPQIVHDLKAIAKKEGLWNMFMPPHKEHDKGEWHGAGLNNLEYAPLAELMGRVSFAPADFVHVQYPVLGHWRFASVGATFVVHVASHPCS